MIEQVSIVRAGKYRTVTDRAATFLLIEIKTFRARSFPIWLIFSVRLFLLVENPRSTFVVIRDRDVTFREGHKYRTNRYQSSLGRSCRVLIIEPRQTQLTQIEAVQVERYTTYRAVEGRAVTDPSR